MKDSNKQPEATNKTFVLLTYLASVFHEVGTCSIFERDLFDSVSITFKNPKRRW